MSRNFSFNSLQRKGVLGFVLLISGILFLNYYLKNKFEPPSDFFIDSEEQIKIRNFIDSVKMVKVSSTPKNVIYPFNPNFITDYRAYTLGMSTLEFDRLKEFRDQDKWINSTEEFKQVTQISDSLLKEIAPYFKFPDWVNQRESRIKEESISVSVAIAKKDLNTATEEDLKEINGVGEVLSKRIVLYRNQLGGFINEIQLKDIYGLKYETRMAIIEKFEVQTPKDFKKIDINKAEVMDLLEIPYIEYELARRIVNYRITREGIKSFDELSEIQGFPFDRMDRLSLFLKIENSH